MTPDLSYDSLPPQLQSGRHEVPLDRNRPCCLVNRTHYWLYIPAPVELILLWHITVFILTTTVMYGARMSCLGFAALQCLSHARVRWPCCCYFDMDAGNSVARASTSNLFRRDHARHARRMARGEPATSNRREVYYRKREQRKSCGVTISHVACAGPPNIRVVQLPPCSPMALYIADRLFAWLEGYNTAWNTKS